MLSFLSLAGAGVSCRWWGSEQWGCSSSGGGSAKEVADLG